MRPDQHGLDFTSFPSSQTFRQFYNEFLVAHGLVQLPNSENKMLAAIEHDEVLKVGELRISFERTIRVPDNKHAHSLPPGLGRFPLFPVSKYADKLPANITNRGGVFMVGSSPCRRIYAVAL